LDTTLQPQSVPIPRRERLTLDEAEFSAVAVGDNKLPGEHIPRREFQNATILVRSSGVGEAGPVTKAAAKRKIPASIDIGFGAKRAPEYGPECALDEKSEIALPVTSAFVTNKRFKELDSHLWPLLEIDVKLRMELVSALGS
jgi:hypothetical protein